MAARRKDSSKKHRATHEEKLRFLSQFKRIPDPTNRRSVSRQYRELNRFAHLHHKANKQAREAARERGFFVTDKGIIIDGPRDGHRNRIKGARQRITTHGEVVWSVGNRRDFIVGLTRAEKKEFAANPTAFTDKKIEELRSRYPLLRSVPKSKIQVRLQWGAYQAQKDFNPSAFSRMTTWEQFRAMHGAGRSRRKGDVDRLTGLHIVVHLPNGKKTQTKSTRRRT